MVIDTWARAECFLSSMFQLLRLHPFVLRFRARPWHCWLPFGRAWDEIVTEKNAIYRGIQKLASRHWDDWLADHAWKDTAGVLRIVCPVVSMQGTEGIWLGCDIICQTTSPIFLDMYRKEEEEGLKSFLALIPWKLVYSLGVTMYHT